MGDINNFWWKKGMLHPSWKGGRTINSRGYIIIRIDKKPIYEHHYIWIQHNQMPIPEGFVVHHLDCDKLNNDINNLALIPKDTHYVMHGKFNYPEGSKFGINAGGYNA